MTNRYNPQKDPNRKKFRELLKEKSLKIKAKAKQIMHQLKGFWPRKIWPRDQEKYKGPKI